MTLNCVENFLSLASAVTGCILIFAFASLIGIPTGTASSATQLKICAITAGIKKCKSIIKKNKKKHYKIVLYKIVKFNSVEVLIDSYISQNELVLVNNELKEYDDIKEEINSLKKSSSIGLSYA